MKRYSFKTEVVIERSMLSQGEITRSTASHMTESSDGQWVLFSEAETLRKFIEDQIPEVRIARLEKALGLVHEGKCPECAQVVRNYKSPQGSFAPEAYATLREAGIDPTTGHKAGCSLNHP